MNVSYENNFIIIADPEHGIPEDTLEYINGDMIRIPVRLMIDSVDLIVTTITKGPLQRMIISLDLDKKRNIKNIRFISRKGSE